MMQYMDGLASRATALSICVAAILLVLPSGCQRQPGAPATPAKVVSNTTAPRALAAEHEGPVLPKQEESAGGGAATDPAEVSEPETTAAPPPTPTVERIVVFTPAGPLLVALELWIDGRPLGEVREELIAAARRERGEEEAADPRESVVIINGKVIPPESASYGAMFSFETGPFPSPSRLPSSPIWQLLDEDRNGRLSVDEIAVAEFALKGRDADDNDLVFPRELREVRGLAELNRMSSGSQDSSRQNFDDPAALWISSKDGYREDSLVWTMEHLYSSHGLEGGAVFPLADRVIEQLDVNQDRYLSRVELRKLAEVAPHIQLAVKLNPGQEAASAVEFSSATDDVGATDQTLVRIPRGVMLRLQGLTVKLELNDTLSAAGDAAQTQFAAFDADQNGYLVEDELPEGDALRGQFARWDLDGDSKLTADEFRAGYQVRRRLEETQLGVRATTGTDTADGLFALLDRNNDGRLGAREMRFAARWLRERDADGDGLLDPEEFPTTTVISITRGPDPMNAMTAMPAQETPSPLPAGPRWFQAMDTNADGDISHREFIGEPRMFELLDANRDEFIDAEEAGNASPAG